MAVLSGRDRGQLLLLGAVVIGFVIVTLSLTLNGGLYAETIANEAVDDVSNEETRYLLADIRGDTAWIITRDPAAHPSGSAAQLNYVERNLTVLNGQYRQYHARSDAVVHVEVDSVEPGTRYTGSFDDSVFPISGPVRNVTLRVTGGSGTRTLAFDDSGDVYEVQMDGSGVTVERPSGSTATCPVSPSTYTVNVSVATVNGEPCPALEFGNELDSSYEVDFDDSGVDGSYTMFANTGGDDVIYAVSIDITHRTPTADYEGTIRVAPGEI